MALNSLLKSSLINSPAKDLTHRSMRFSPSIGLVEHIAFKGFDIGTFIRLMSRMLEATSFRPLANERPRLDLFHLLWAFVI